MATVSNSVIVQDPEIHSGKLSSAARASLSRRCWTTWKVETLWMSS